ncbi:BTAD domain-containing putative transcriptional regulator [Streptomyces sp. MAR4 CNX-425]|uniref:AfsR/SARP family transcriptional regulator n=1 Tax=Streptomyces sp. MAR4 CNX-425 TaxID=3406343 RepID=UPI003B501210
MAPRPRGEPVSRAEGGAAAPGGARHAAAQAPALRFSVLGPVRAWRGEESLPTGSPQQRALLAALLLRGGRAATARELVEDIWGADPPPRAPAALRTYASRLRRVVGGAFVSEAGGYVLRLPGTELDLAEAERLASAAEAARGEGDAPRARQLYAAALAEFRGEPLAGVPGPYARRERARLAELRVALLEQRLALDLDAGGHVAAVSELTALTAAHPLRERFRELLMIALYRSGRQAEALAVYADVRRLLRDELGLDPRAGLSELQQRILRADPDLDAPGRGPEPTRTREVARPTQLPATVGDFTGRNAVEAEVVAGLAEAPGTVAVCGTGGVGKTTLAVQAAHAVRDLFPDGQLYVDLQGSGPAPADPATVLGAFLRALGVADADIPGPVAERAALYRSTLTGRRVLTLLDNARDAAQVRPLLPGNAGCAALVTSRTRLLDLAGARLVDLDVLSPDEALELFSRIAGAERVAPERDAALDAVAACGFLPLAIRIAAARLTARRTWTVSVLARKLADGRRRLDELRAGDLAVEATFELGYGQLAPRHARAFRLLGLVDASDISLAAAAAVLGLGPAEAEEDLEFLVDANLVESAAPYRYRCGDLARLFARSRAEREEPAADRAAALSRLLDFYLATAGTAYGLCHPGDRLPDRLAPVSYPGLAFDSHEDARAWLFAEADSLLAAVRQLAHGETLARAVDLLLAARDLAEPGAYPVQFARAAAPLPEAARRAGDVRCEGRAHAVLAAAHRGEGDLERADEHASRAAPLAGVADDVLIQAESNRARGIVATTLGRYPAAASHLERALKGYRAEGDLAGEAAVLGSLARVYADTDRAGAAVDLAERALALHRRLDAPFATAGSLYTLGSTLSRVGRPAEARDRLARALELFRTQRMPVWEGMTHFRLAEALLADHDFAPAAAHAEEALSLLAGSGSTWHRAGVLTVLGRALSGLGQHDRARACFQEALAGYQESGAAPADDPVEQVRRLLEAPGGG